MMMSGEIIYSDVTFTRHQNQDTRAESEVSNGEFSLTYSALLVFKHKFTIRHFITLGGEGGDVIIQQGVSNRRRLYRLLLTG